MNKIDANRARDQKKISELEAMGWRVIVIWECELKQGKQDDTLRRIVKMLGAYHE